MSKNILEVDSVQKFYDQKLVVSDVYLNCQSGEVIGLLGRNGSGKSTLLKAIFGIIPVEYKFVRINGIVKQTTAALLKDISYLSQDNFIPQYFSVKRVIKLSISIDKIASFCQDEMISSILDKKIAHLSGGELRYLEIKLVLNNPSKFVLLDEPYNGLSPVMVAIVNQLIKENSSTKGIIITDHNYRNILEVATKIILMKDGKAHHINEKSELIEKGYLLEGML
jgi:ABC-type multidrug transport system ATPase subunit